MIINNHSGKWKASPCTAHVKLLHRRSSFCIRSQFGCLTFYFQSFFFYFTNIALQTHLPASHFSGKSMNIVCLFIWASQMLSVFFYHSYFHLTNTIRLWFIYILHLAVVHCYKMPQKQLLLHLKKKKTPAISFVFFPVAVAQTILTSECLFVALQFCTCSAPFKLWNMVIEVCSSYKMCYL